MSDNEFGEEAIAQDDAVSRFSDILQKMEETNYNIVVPVLKKIESNTAQAQKKVGSTVQAPRKPVKVVTAVASKATLPGRKGHSHSEAIKSEKKEIATAEARPVVARNSRGRFVSSLNSTKPAQDVNERSGGPKENRGRLSALAAFALHMGKSSLKDKKGTMMEAAGRATLGPMFDAAMEAKDSYDQFLDKGRSLKDQYGQFKGAADAVPVNKEAADVKNVDDTDEIIKSLQNSETEDEKRHKELIQAILKEKESKGDGGLPSPKKTGPGAVAREKLKKERAKPQLPTGAWPAKMPKMPGGGGDGILGGLGAMLPKLGPLLAVAGAGLAGFGAGSLINSGINKAGEAITGKKGWTAGGQIYDWTLGDSATTFETGKGKTATQAAATISTGKGDAGGKSYGSYQLSSKRGETANFLQKSGYADQFKGFTVGTKGFDDKWKQTAAQDPKFAAAQKQYAIETKYNPQMEKLAKSGIDLSGKGKAVQEMVLSTANQYGSNTSVISKALKGKDVASMSEADIVNTVQDYKAAKVGSNFKSSSSEVQAGVAKRIQDERAYLLAADTKEKNGGATTVAKPTVATAMSNPAAQEPVATTIATSNVAARVKQPERIQPTMDYLREPAGSSAGSAGAGASQNVTANITTIPGLDKLIATLSKNAGKEEERYMKGGVGQIRTEFDDTMLTLMAYDRV